MHGNILSDKIKKIQATPELSGQDAISILKQVEANISTEALEKNAFLQRILHEIRK